MPFFGDNILKNLV